MATPRIEIDLGKIGHNAKKLKSLYATKGINIAGVTKVVCGDPKIVSALQKSGIEAFADSRIANIRSAPSPNVFVRCIGIGLFPTRKQRLRAPHSATPQHPAAH